MKDSTIIGKFEISSCVPMRDLDSLVQMLREVEQFLPGWIQEIHVDMDNDQADAAASIVVRYDYRRATIYLSLKFFDAPERQLRVLVHELCHILQEPLWNHTKDLRDHILVSGKGERDLLTEVGRHAREQSVCDTADILMRILDRQRGPDHSTIRNFP